MKYILLVAIILTQGRAHAFSNKEAAATLREIDRRTTHKHDYFANVYLSAKQKGKTPLAWRLNVYRRDRDRSVLLLFVAPKDSKGFGYLRKKKNLWSYDPTVGKWVRKTLRERIGGSGAMINDFDKSEFAQNYNPTYKTDKKLGKYVTHVVELKAKKNALVAYPRVKLWIDKVTHNILMRKEYSSSGKLLRTSYFPKWIKVQMSDRVTWYPEKMLIFDEIMKDRTTIIIKGANLKPMHRNIFTKAWLEFKSRGP